MKAIVKNTCDATDGFTTGNCPYQLSMCNAYFQTDKAYDVIIDTDLYAGVFGELTQNTNIYIYNGSVDGYDTPSGVKFTDIHQANRYFSFYED